MFVHAVKSVVGVTPEILCHGDVGNGYENSDVAGSVPLIGLFAPLSS